MQFFIDPIIVTFPSLTSANQDGFIDFVEAMNDWAMLRESSEHIFYTSEQCISELYNSDYVEYPPHYETFEKYWEKFEVSSLYPLNEAYQAFQKLIDIESLTTIESLVNKLKNKEPKVEVVPERVEVIPNAICVRHHEKMKKALEGSLGYMAFFSHEENFEQKEIFHQMWIASKTIIDSTLEDIFKIVIETLVFINRGSSDDILEEALPSVSFPIATDPEELKHIFIEQNRIAEGSKFIILGGHPNLIRQLDDLKKKRSIQVYWVAPDDKNKSREVKNLLNYYDGIIVITYRNSHSVGDFRNKADDRDIPIAFVNDKGLIPIYRAMANICKEIS